MSFQQSQRRWLRVCIAVLAAGCLLYNLPVYMYLSTLFRTKPKMALYVCIISAQVMSLDFRYIHLTYMLCRSITIGTLYSSISNWMGSTAVVSVGLLGREGIPGIESQPEEYRNHARPVRRVTPPPPPTPTACTPWVDAHLVRPGTIACFLS